MESLNPYYPAFLDLRGRLIAVIGGGVVALRKVDTLLKAGARIRVVAPEILPDFRLLPVEIRQKAYDSSDVEGAVLVFAATGDSGVNAAVNADAEKAGLFCNVIEEPGRGSFIVPALVERGPIKIAISTGGFSPALARRLRVELGCQVGEEYEKLALILGHIRPLVLAQPGGAETHRRIFEILVNSELVEALHAGDKDEAEAILEQALGVSVRLEDVL